MFSMCPRCITPFSGRTLFRPGALPASGCATAHVVQDSPSETRLSEGDFSIPQFLFFHDLLTGLSCRNDCLSLYFQKPVDSGADMNAFAFYHNITCRGHGYERQLVTTQCRRGFHKRARLAVEGLCAVDVVCHLY